MLLATPIGQPVYEKLGFKTISNYIFLKRAEKKEWNTENDKIIDYDSKYFEEIAILDQLAMGEDRSEILKHFTKDAQLYIDQELEGFYFPHLGDGLIIAKKPQSGICTFKNKMGDKK